MSEVKPIIVALDYSNREEVLTFLDSFDFPIYVKVGMELYYKEGPSILEEIKQRGHPIFLDLKLHDIPNTVGKAMANLNTLGVTMTNLHAAGGQEMMEAARKNFDGILLAVTQLTSTNQEIMNTQQGILGTVEDSVLRYANLAKEAGLDGVVCSPLEVEGVSQNIPNFLTVTPGIRPKGSVVGDQKRIMTPIDAKNAGSSYIVVGRPITQAANPKQAFLDIVTEWENQQ